MEKANKDIRAKAKESGIALWRIAAALGISEFTFVRYMRTELNDVWKAKVFQIIEELSKA